MEKRLCPTEETAWSTTECHQTAFAFHPLGPREVVARFDGGTITSDAGGLLLREVERRTGILRQFAACFTDHRDPDLIEHVEQLEPPAAGDRQGRALGQGGQPALRGDLVAVIGDRRPHRV